MKHTHNQVLTVEVLKYLTFVKNKKQFLCQRTVSPFCGKYSMKSKGILFPPTESFQSDSELTNKVKGTIVLKADYL
jgi:hypothetical protein